MVPALMFFIHIGLYPWGSCPGHSGGGAGKEGELATTSLEFEYVDQKKSMQNADWWR